MSLESVSPKPWTFFLTFIDPAFEHSFRDFSGYQAIQREKWAAHGVTAMIAPCLVGAVIECVYRSRMYLAACWLAMSLAKYGIIHRRIDLYAQHRTVFGIVSLILFSLLAHCLGFNAAVGDFERAKLGLGILLCAPWLPIVIQSVDHRFLFKEQAFLQLLSSVLSARWVWGLHKSCTDGQGGGDMCPSWRLGSVVERGLVRSAFFGAPLDMHDESTESWIPPVLWLHFAVTFVVPCFLVYCLEVYDRACYLVLFRSTSVECRHVWEHVAGSLFLAVLFAFILAQVAWFATTAVGKVVQMQLEGPSDFCERIVVQ